MAAWYEKDPERFCMEMEVLKRFNSARKAGYEAIPFKKKKGVIVITGKLRPARNTFEYECIIPPDYPHEPPEVCITSPELPDDTPHMFTDNQVCLWRTSSGKSIGRWNGAVHTWAFALGCLQRWVLAFELWYSTGKWRVREAP